MMEFLKSIVPLTIAYAAPLLIIAIGGLFSERSGVINIGLEGLMGIGAFTSAYVIYLTTGSLGDFAPYAGLIAAVIAGGLFSLLHAFASVTMRSDQVVSGTAINIMSMALTVYLARSLTGSANVQILFGFIKDDVPVLSRIPLIGPLLFTNAYITSLIVLVLVVISWYVLFHRPFGLRLRACGENPQAADSLGINVLVIRYIGVVLSGMLAGLGGGIVITTYSGEFSPLIFNGLGFLALAALIFGKWDPWGVLWASLFFGFAKTIADMSKLYQALGNMPNIIFNTFPYVVTLVALVLFSKNSSGPRAAGEPYDPGKR